MSQASMSSPCRLVEINVMHSLSFWGSAKCRRPARQPWSSIQTSRSVASALPNQSKKQSHRTQESERRLSNCPRRHRATEASCRGLPQIPSWGSRLSMTKFRSHGISSHGLSLDALPSNPRMSRNPLSRQGVEMVVSKMAVLFAASSWTAPEGQGK